MKIAIVVADFNSEITVPMERCAREHAASPAMPAANPTAMMHFMPLMLLI